MSDMWARPLNGPPESVPLALPGARAVVTGASSSGLAAQIGVALAGLGAEVVLAFPGIGGPGERRTIAGGGTVRSHPCDPTDPAEAAAMFRRAAVPGGGIDVCVVLVGTTGDTAPGSVWLDQDAADLALRVALLGAGWCARPPGSGGSVILAACSPSMGDAVAGLAARLAPSWAGRGVRVGSLVPDDPTGGASAGMLRALAAPACRWSPQIHGRTPPDAGRPPVTPRSRPAR